MKLILLFIIQIALVFSKCHAHTWSPVSATSGVWQGKMVSLNEDINFVTRNCTTLGDFQISPTQNLTIGFDYEKDDNFNIIYALVLVGEKSKEEMISPSCVYLITAYEPAHPDIRAASYHGANCHFKPANDGTHYYVGV